MKEIPLTNSQLSALVDDEDWPMLAIYTWRLDAQGYAKNNKKMHMHRLVLGFPSAEIDHINRQKLDNRKSNLREVTRQQNTMNRGHARTNLVGLKGVSRRKSPSLSKPWFSRVHQTINGKQKRFYLGYFATAEDAARAYDAKAKELYGEYAYLNFSEEEQ